MGWIEGRNGIKEKDGMDRRKGWYGLKESNG